MTGTWGDIEKQPGVFFATAHGNSARRLDLKVPRDQHHEKGNAHDTVHGRARGGGGRVKRTKEGERET